MALLKPKFKYKQAFQISVLVNLILLVMGLLLLINSPVEAAAKLSRIGSTGQTTSYKLQMTKNDIVFTYCPNDEPNLGYLRNQKALTCP